jgi:galactokinase
MKPTFTSLAQDAAAALGREPDWIAAAPGRVNLIGEHIDYCDGFVMPFAIDRYVVMAAAKNGSSVSRWSSEGQPDAFISHAEPQQIGEPAWANYLRGVIEGFRSLGHDIPGIDVAVVSSVPRGAGLSSSAALECATATLLENVLGIDLPKAQKALICQKAEHDFAGVPCGIMDQYASTFGEANRVVKIDCRSGEVQLVPFENADLTVIIANTCVHHQLSDGAYAIRRKHTEQALAALGKNSWREVTLEEVQEKWDQLGVPVNRRARHVVTEMARTQQAAEALAAGEYQAFGALMDASHASLRDDFEVSCAELDAMVDIAQSLRGHGVLGARMTGGGFGGSTVTLCETARAEEVMAIMHERYRAVTGIEPQIFSSRPSRGAHALIMGD